MSKYVFTKDMHEISGFGGGYEECCRNMLTAALEWLDANPKADPKFRGFKDVYGILMDDNDDAKALSKAATSAAGEYGATGAMHQAVISAAMYVKTKGWDAYVKEMTHPEGEAGLLREKLERTEKDLELYRKRLDEADEEIRKRGRIIAAKVLNWKEYKVSNGQQEAYAPSQEAAVKDIYAGCQLSKLVDDAINEMAA